MEYDKLRYKKCKQIITPTIFKNAEPRQCSKNANYGEYCSKHKEEGAINNSLKTKKLR